jgi:predicted  nucleic acid-binding Zn-ribbon protein
MSVEAENSDMTEEEHRFALDADGDVTLPVVDVLTGRGFITGKSGSGKSNSASVVVEELLGGGYPVLIVDTDGEYWGLKETYEILHVGADEECDLQVGPEHAEKLADLALDQNVPIILDVSGFLDESEASGLIRETARHLFAKEKKLKKPFLMLVEEIHEYIPQSGGMDETGEMLVKIGKRGRKHGLGLVGISQRPADVKKDFITQCDWLLWHRLTWENDTTVVGGVVGNDYADAVQDLGDGEAFLMADWESDITRVQVRRKETFDAGATPDLGDFERPELKSVSGDLVDELEDISDRKRREEDRISELEQQLERREERIDELEDELESARDMRNLAQQMAEGLQASGGDGASVASEKVDELIEERNSLQSDLEDAEERVDELEQEASDLRDELETRPEAGDVEAAREATERLAEALGVSGDGEAAKWRRKYETAHERVQELEAEDNAPGPDVMEHPSVERYISRMQSELSGLGEKEAEMLAWYKFSGPGTAADAYWAAGGSRKSSARNKKNKTLKQKDLIEEGDGRGEYQYALPGLVAEWFADNDSVGDEHLDAIVREIESELEAM